MRLLKRLPSGGFDLVSFSDDPPRYAILSHTWTEGQEVTYNELVAGTGTEKTGYAKIRFCGERAAADGLEYFWVDTCCIDKSTSDELSTAINSMFRWYQRASKCYVYLSDVSVLDDITDAEAFQIAWQGAFRHSRWFTRGWTLQELLAPPSVEFFCKQGKRLGSRVSLELEIHEITKIPIAALRGQSLTKFSVEDRMGWAAGRTTTLNEDKVYCLLGIFGVFLSLIYGEGEAYATLRLKEEIRRRQEGRGTGTSRGLSIFSSLPFPRNELFVGRTDELQSLEQYLLVSNTHRRMTVYGLGGCGKSALAIEFAYRALATHARVVFWVPAISQESFELAYREIGGRLHIPGIDDDNADVKRLVQETLNSERVDPWLMIVDNADDLEVLLATTDSDSQLAQLSDYLPHSDRGAILFTTRSRKVAGALTQSSILGLTDMGKTEARQLLALRLTQQTLLNGETAFDELLEALAYLPLAIVQAAAFMNNNDVSVSSYVSLFRQAGAETELFNQHFYDPSRYKGLDSTIAKTWHISFDQIRKQDPLAAEYLSFMACIDRVNIPQSLLPSGTSLVQQTKALGTLKGYAFISERLKMVQESDRGRFFDMHRLVHMASVRWLERHNERATWADAAVARLKELVPYGGHENKEVWTMYLSHAIHASGIHGVDKAASASLLDRVGWCQASLWQYSAAETTHRQVLSIREKALGLEHPDTLASLNNIAGALSSQGKYAEAEKIDRKTLELRKKVLGDEHPDTLTSMNNVALALSDQGKYAEAEKMHREELRLSKKVSGDEHPDTLMSMSNVAAALSRQGKYAEAEEMHRETLRLRKKVLGDKHPDTLGSMSYIAASLSRQGKYAEAEKMHREALRLREKVLGDEHPDTLGSMSHVAVALSSQGKYAEAEKMHRETLELRKKVLGNEHPDTLTSMNNVAAALSSQGKYAEAKEMHRKTLSLRRKVLRDKHPETLTSMSHVALALSSQGKYAEAEKMHRETLELRKKVLGNEHPETLTSMNNVAAALSSQGKYAEAEEMHRKTLSLRKKVLRDKHTATLTSMSHVAAALSGQGKYAEAEEMHRETLELRKKVLGDEHPDTLTSMGYVAAALSSQGKYAEAEEMHRETLELRKKVSGDEHPATLTSMNNVALALSDQGKYAEAEKMHREELRLSKKVLGEEHPDTLTSMNNVTFALSDQGKYAEAEEMHRETLRLRKKVSGDEHPDTLTSMNNIAGALSNQGNYAEAEEMHRETLRLRKKVSGDEHPATLTSMNNVALALSGQGKYAEAEEMHRETLRLRKKALGDEHPDTLTSMNNVALALSDQGKYTEAEKMHLEALKLRKKVLGNEHPDTLASMRNVARALSGQGKYVEAEEMHRETLELRKKVSGEEHPHTLTSMYSLAQPPANKLRYNDSRFLHGQAYATSNTVLGEDPQTSDACHQNYRQMPALQEQNRISVCSGRLESSAGGRTNKRRKLG